MKKHLIILVITRVILYLQPYPSHNKPDYNLLVENTCPGLAPTQHKSNQPYIRHNLGNGYGGSPQPVSINHYNTLYRIYLRYHMQALSCKHIGKYWIVHCINHLHTYCIIRYHKQLEAHYDKHCIVLKTDEIWIKRPLFKTKCNKLTQIYTNWFMRVYKKLYILYIWQKIANA